MEFSYNARCPAVKRLMKEAKELCEATEEYFAQPLEDNLFEWHFTVRGPPDTDFEGGIYHGRIILPTDYPMKPPNIIFVTPNGRFKTSIKICLSISGHHPESWRPSWSIRTALLAIIGFMPTQALGSIGGVDYTSAERKALAKKSLDFECDLCGRVCDLLKERTGDNADLQAEARQLSQEMAVVPAKKDSVTEKDEEREDEISSVPEDSVPSPPEVVVPVSQELNTLSSATEVAENNNQSSATTPLARSWLFSDSVLYGAIALLIALIIRRLFMMDTDNSNNEHQHAFL